MPADPTSYPGPAPAVGVDRDRLEAALAETFGGTPGERRVVARQARDLDDAGKLAADRGRPLAAADVVENLRDAPGDRSLAERWNWWLGALELAYGGYRPFQIERVPVDDPERSGVDTDRSGVGSDRPAEDDQ